MTELEKNRGAYHEDSQQRGSGDMSGETIVGTAYLWDGNTIAEEAPLQANGEADWDRATKWYYEPDTFKPIAKETVSGDLFYIINDHLGTPREMFSEDGKLVWAAQYRTWGAIHKIWQADNDNDIRGPYPPPIRGNLAFKYDTVEAQAAQTCPIRFQGQWEDAETGLYYNRYRYYDPLAAQYISPDPIGLAGGLRSNGYVHNPNAWIDPWGLAKKCCATVAQEIIDNAKEGKVKIVKKSHADNHGFEDKDIKSILSDPDGVYLSKNGNFVFHKGENVVITAGTGSDKGTVITAYGSAGIKGETGASALGGLASDKGGAITAEMITGGGIPKPSGGFLPPATRIDLN